MVLAWARRRGPPYGNCPSILSRTPTLWPPRLLTVTAALLFLLEPSIIASSGAEGTASLQGHVPPSYAYNPNSRAAAMESWQTIKLAVAEEAEDTHEADQQSKAASMVTGRATGLTASAASAGSCSAVLQSGVYNTYRSSQSSASQSWSQFQYSACQDYSAYTYDAYSTEYDQLSRTASGDCSSNQVSNTRASSFTLGASYLKIGGSLGVGWSTGTSTSSDRCITGSKMNRDQFAQASAALASYRDSACSGSSGASGSLTDQTLSVLQQTVDPNVYNAYLACIKLFSAGVQVSQTSAMDSQMLAIDIKFAPNLPDSTATLTGVSIRGPATCLLTGRALPNITRTSITNSTAMALRLLPNAVYTITCQLPDNLPSPPASQTGNGTLTTRLNYTSIFISTDVGGSFTATLYHTPPASRLDQLETKVAALAARLEAVEAWRAQLTQNFQNLVNRVRALENRTAAFANATNGTNSVTALVGDYKWSAAPRDHDGWLLCNGRTVSRRDYAALFAVIGTSFGSGDGHSTFNLPDARGRVVGAVSSDIRYDDATNSYISPRGMGEIVGTEWHRLEQSEMPYHTHNGYTDGAGGHEHLLTPPYNLVLQDVDGSGNCWASCVLSRGFRAYWWTKSTSAGYYTTWVGDHRHYFSTNAEGGDVAHNNMQPTLFAGRLFIYGGVSTKA